jgi:transposase
MTNEIKARLRWVNLYLETKNANLVCRRCGISKLTLRLWVRRFQKDGMTPWEVWWELSSKAPFSDEIEAL